MAGRADGRGQEDERVAVAVHVHAQHLGQQTSRVTTISLAWQELIVSFSCNLVRSALGVPGTASVPFVFIPCRLLLYLDKVPRSLALAPPPLARPAVESGQPAVTEAQEQIPAGDELALDELNRELQAAWGSGVAPPNLLGSLCASSPCL